MLNITPVFQVEFQNREFFLLLHLLCFNVHKGYVIGNYYF